MRRWAFACRTLAIETTRQAAVGAILLAWLLLNAMGTAYAGQIVENPNTTVRVVTSTPTQAQQASEEIWVSSDDPAPPQSNPARSNATPKTANQAQKNTKTESSGVTPEKATATKQKRTAIGTVTYSKAFEGSGGPVRSTSASSAAAEGATPQQNLWTTPLEANTSAASRSGPGPAQASPHTGGTRLVFLQQDQQKPAQKADAAQPPTGPVQLGPFEVFDHTEELSVVLHRSKLLRTKVDIRRTAVVNPTVCDVVQFTPRELSVIGRSQGATHVTFWFEDATTQPLTFLVRVAPDPEVQERREEQYSILEEILAELFPDSKVRLTPVADKLIVRGQARDAAEAAQIMTVVRGEAVLGRGLVGGRAADPLVQEETNEPLPATQVINMLRIPGVQQVALRVKIAELNRTAARNFGVDLDITMTFDGGSLLLQSLLNAVMGASGVSGTLIGSFDQDQIQFGINYLEKHGVLRMLSEPTLVTLSGRPASFVAGGEFAVPTTVGVGGASAVTTDFRAYGAIITFLPVVVDKDLIRLEVAPEFSQLDSETTVNDTPGLNTRAVTTTVEMREGQTFAIAGLLEDTMKSNLEGDIPLLAHIFGKREVTRNETELLILVTPELVQPMEPEEVPPLPGFDVTEPTNLEFYLMGHIEGRPTYEYRSTIWPRLRRRYQAGGPAMISGPFGHGD